MVEKIAGGGALLKSYYSLSRRGAETKYIKA